MSASILLIDDEQNALTVLSAILTEGGYTVLQSNDWDKAIEILQGMEVDAVITDLKMPAGDGMQFFDNVSIKHPGLPVIFLTAYGTVESAVEAMTKGAFYYFVKPPDYSKLKRILLKAVEQHRGTKGAEQMKNSAGDPVLPVFGKSSQMRKALEMVDAVKDSASNVLIRGEKGTGKEVIARAIHARSIRRDGPFIAVKCAAIRGKLMETELFGCQRGEAECHSSGASKFEAASGGTIFLDRIDEIELTGQAELLRVLEERETEKAQGKQKTRQNFRLISSTSGNIGMCVREGSFREDLLCRINTVEIRIPSLKETRNDLPFLISEFLKEFCQRKQKAVTISDDAMHILLKYRWPGNIRQLRDTLERAVILARGDEITLKELPSELRCLRRRMGLQFTRTLKEIESQAVKHALSACKGNKSRAAKILGISRKAFYKRLKEN